MLLLIKYLINEINNNYYISTFQKRYSLNNLILPIKHTTAH